MQFPKKLLERQDGMLHICWKKSPEKQGWGNIMEAYPIDAFEGELWEVLFKENILKPCMIIKNI